MFLFSSNSAYTLSFSNAPILSLLSSILVDRSIIESSDDALNQSDFNAMPSPATAYAAPCCTPIPSRTIGITLWGSAFIIIFSPYDFYITVVKV